MQYEVSSNIATLTFDDGKANAVGHRFLDDINAGLVRILAHSDHGFRFNLITGSGPFRSWIPV